jgi:hypothetical protein
MTQMYRSQEVVGSLQMKCYHLSLREVLETVTYEQEI